MYIYIVALCVGVDAREFWPATVIGASKADASVQHMKARGKGFADLLSMLEKAHKRVTNRFSPDVILIHDFQDDEQDQIAEDLRKKRTETLAVYVREGAITAKEFRALGISRGVLDAEVLDHPDALAGMQNFEEAGETEETPSPEESGVPVSEEESSAESDELQDEDSDDLSKLSKLTDKVFAKLPNYSGWKVTDLRYKDENAYERALRAAARGLWNGSLDAIAFVGAMDSALQRGLTDAAFVALSELGLSVSDLTFEERLAVTKEIAFQTSFVVGLADWILRNRRGVSTLGTIYKRIKLWVNTYTKMKNLVKTLVGGDIKLQWVWNPVKEHCKDCERLNGRVYRSKTWAKYNIRPQSASLACGGFKCGCTLIPTNLPATPGYPPTIG